MDRNGSAILLPWTISHIFIVAGNNNNQVYSNSNFFFFTLTINKAVSKEALRSLSFKFVCY